MWETFSINSEWICWLIWFRSSVFKQQNTNKNWLILHIWIIGYYLHLHQSTSNITRDDKVFLSLIKLRITLTWSQVQIQCILYPFNIRLTWSEDLSVETIKYISVTWLSSQPFIVLNHFYLSLANYPNFAAE